MRLLREIRIRARQATPQVVAACMVAYFAYHALHGDRGFYAWILLKQEKSQAEAVAERVAQERLELAHRVALLRREHLDPDLLEERAQAILGYGAEGDHVIFLEPALRRPGGTP
jgi:cell division protein FtsB